MNDNEWDGDDRCWSFKIGSAIVQVVPRPPYCDRGHWLGNVYGVPYIDIQDAFPRYYMDLERAKLEMSEWLRWRLEQEKKRG